jgi:polyvinyl alcohol dehydrogenase (cytochrome)
VWMSQPVVDHETGMLYVTTGNSYSVPQGYCVKPRADQLYGAPVRRPH